MIAISVIMVVVIILMFSFMIMIFVVVMAMIVMSTVTPMPTVLTNGIPVVDVSQGFMWISDACQVLGSRSIVQFFEHRVGTRVGVCFCDVAFEIVQVTKFDGLGWT